MSAMEDLPVRAIERRTVIYPWPRALERRAMTRRARLFRWLRMHAMDGAMGLLVIGLLGLILGTANGSRPIWPAPIVFYVTSGGALLAALHAIVRPAWQNRLAAILGVGAATLLRGLAYLLQGPESGFRIGAAVGAYIIAVALVVIVVAQAFGETLGGRSTRWGP